MDEIRFYPVDLMSRNRELIEFVLCTFILLQKKGTHGLNKAHVRQIVCVGTFVMLIVAMFGKNPRKTFVK